MTYETKVRTWLWVVLATVVVLGGGFTYWYTQGNKNIVSSTISPTPTLSTAKKSPTTSPTSSSTTDWQTYKNDTYGFSLTFPDSWKGYTTKTTKNYDSSTASIEFYLKTTDPIWIKQLNTDEVSVFVITVATPDQWTKLQQEEGPKPQYINKNDNYYFSYSFWQDAPTDLRASNIDPNTVISTFKLSN